MKIAITRTESDDKQQNYIKWLKGNDDIEVTVLSSNRNTAKDIEGFDALVLSGGVDIHPEFYGGPLSYEKSPSTGWNKERDVFEQSIFANAIEKNIPVLGICRGLQLINVALKGTLVQNLGDDLNTIHEGGPDKSHPVNITKGSLLYEITGSEKAEINSAHHQAIDKLGEGLVINAKSDEGVIEGIEWKNAEGKPFLLAVQWHPERMAKFKLENSGAAKLLRERFINEIKKHSR